MSVPIIPIIHPDMQPNRQEQVPAAESEEVAAADYAQSSPGQKSSYFKKMGGFFRSHKILIIVIVLALIAIITIIYFVVSKKNRESMQPSLGELESASPPNGPGGGCPMAPPASMMNKMKNILTPKSSHERAVNSISDAKIEQMREKLQNKEKAAAAVQIKNQMQMPMPPPPHDSYVPKNLPQAPPDRNIPVEVEEPMEPAAPLFTPDTEDEAPLDKIIDVVEIAESADSSDKAENIDTPTLRQCKITLATGRQCKIPTQNGEDTCHVHKSREIKQAF